MFFYVYSYFKNLLKARAAGSTDGQWSIASKEPLEFTADNGSYVARCSVRQCLQDNTQIAAHIHAYKCMHARTHARI
jgi:hypothetical protein